MERGAVGRHEPRQGKAVPRRNADFASEILLFRAHGRNRRFIARDLEDARDRDRAAGDRALAELLRDRHRRGGDFRQR